jgi:SAM-dependent methyltransferase
MQSEAAELFKCNIFMKYRCPSCFGEEIRIFYEIDDLPVHSVLLLQTREEALNLRKGNIKLGLCRSCGFVSNYAFDPKLHEYSSRYESSQAFSPTYNSFSKRLAEHLVERYGLHNKNIVEIGCGQGEFVRILAELGGNHGIGYDPAYDGSRSYNIPDISSDIVTVSEIDDRFLDNAHPASCRGCVTIVPEFYGGSSQLIIPDFICCKMTLEHIQNASGFIRTIRRSLGEKSDAVVFFQVPDFTRILDEIAFWDIYYEHCSYFSPGSLSRLFRRCGFEIIDVWTDYDGQYLMIEAGARRKRAVGSIAEEDDIDELRIKVRYFHDNYRQKLYTWKRYLNEIKAKDLKAVVWGSSSKGVSLLTTLKIQYQELEYVVDINTFRQGSYIAGTGQKIVSPEFMVEYKPDVVIVMNPVYHDEIKSMLEGMKLKPEIVTVNQV